MRAVTVAPLFAALLALSLLVGVADARALAFAPRVAYHAGTSPIGVCAADLDEDGTPDLVTANQDDSTISVLLNRGNGTFAPAATYAAGLGCGRVAAADLDRDGHLDLVAVDRASDCLSVYLGKGDGTFSAQTQVPCGNWPMDAVIADFDRDGALDVAASDYQDGGVNVVMGHGDGSFGAAAHFATTGSPSWGIAVTDWNLDGKLDLLVVDQGRCRVVTMLGDGTGRFAPAGWEYCNDFEGENGFAITSVVSLDFDHDGKPDAVVGPYGGAVPYAGIRGTTGDGDSGFYYEWHYWIGPPACGLALGDFDNDGNTDIAAANTLSDSASVLLASGSFFSGSVTMPTGQWPETVTTADFNGDGRLDMATADGNSDCVSVFLGTYVGGPSGGFAIDGGAAAARDRLVRIDSPVADAAEMRLRNEGGVWSAWQAKTTPVDWTLTTGDGVKTVEAQYRNPKGTIDRTDTIVLDTVAPSTTDDAPAGWQKASPVTVTLTAGDAGGSGVAATQYKLDDAVAWSTGTAVPVTGDGVHTLRYRSVDAAGNVGETGYATVRLDATAPSTTASGAASGWRSGPRTVVFSARDDASGVAATHYTTDGGATWATGDSVTVDAEGATTVGYYSTDEAGNDETGKTLTLDIDATAPSTTDDAPAGWQKVSPVTVTLTAGDAGGSGVAATQYKLDDAVAWSTGTKVPVAGDGVHTLRYRSVDAAGNTEETQSRTIKIDATAPVTIARGADDGWHNERVFVYLSATDATSGVASTQYSLDGGSAVTGAFLVVGEPGDHTLSFQSADCAGNGETPSALHVRIDRTRPTTVAAAARVKRFQTTTLRFCVNDALPCGPTGTAQLVITTVRGRVVSRLPAVSAPVNVASTLAYRCGLRPGTYRIVVLATDAAGNTARPTGSAKLVVQ
jgi:hypothetical protein